MTIYATDPVCWPDIKLFVWVADTKAGLRYDGF